MDEKAKERFMETIKGTFIPNEVEILIEAVQEMFNKLSRYFDLSSTIWNHPRDNSIRDKQFLLESLEGGENQRIQEIKKTLEHY